MPQDKFNHDLIYLVSMSHDDYIASTTLYCNQIFRIISQMKGLDLIQ